MNAAPYVIPGPLFVMALPRSFGSLVGAMVGQHAQMYGLPETHLFGCETIAEWCDRSSRESFNMADGLVRAVSQLYFGEQDEIAVIQSKAWLRRRRDFTTGFLLETLGEKVGQRMLVDKSPSIAYSLASMQRAYAMFPLAKFLHVTQHPRAYGESVMNSIREAAENGPVPQWMLDLASFPATPPIDGDATAHHENLDPQRGWYELNTNVCGFLDTIPQAQKFQVRGEELIAGPDRILSGIAAWLEISTDPKAIEEMKHPERSPYACLGPPSARYGSDHDFLAHPTFESAPQTIHSLDGAVSWRRDGAEFSAEVKQLAQRFGYA